MNHKIITICYLILIIIPMVSAFEYLNPTGYVNDYANILSQDEITYLNNEIIAIEKETTVEIAIVTVDSLNGMSIEEYAVKLFEKWGIGKKKNDNGLLIIVSKNDREYRIETGYGLEGTITDARASRIGREFLEPYFKKGEYGDGLYAGILEIKGLLNNEPSIVSKYEGSTNINQTNQSISNEELKLFAALSILIICIILYYSIKDKDKTCAVSGWYSTEAEYEAKIAEVDKDNKNNKIKRTILKLIIYTLPIIISIYSLLYMPSFVFYLLLVILFILIIYFIISRFGGGSGGRSKEERGSGGEGRSHDRGFSGGRSGGGGYSGKW